MLLPSFSLLLGVLFVLVASDDLPDCGFKMPISGKCIQNITWRARSEKDALATCYDYFPTTFITATNDASTIACTVTAAYKCLDDNHHLIFDKCYYFSGNTVKDGDGKVDSTKYIEGKMEERKKLCPGANIAVFYSYNHAKFVAMEAHRKGIDKLWIGITKDGKKVDDDKFLVHKKLWKVEERDYWDGETLKIGSNENAKYLFLRTRTDYELSRWQGTFEQATANTKATFACEVDAVFASDQKWYCDKMQVLSIDAVYDEASSRCLYVSSSKYAYDGSADDMKNIKACQENPSPLHLNGMDDGTGTSAIYSAFKNKEKLRLAGYRTSFDNSKDRGKGQRGENQKKCKGSETDNIRRFMYFIMWKLLSHNGLVQHPLTSNLDWDEKYPLNECSDFLSESTTLGVRNGLLVDLPPEARLKAVCSIMFFQECQIKDKPCGKWKECANTNTYQSSTDGYFTCKCPENHNEAGPRPEDKCFWKTQFSNDCAWLMFYDEEPYMKLDNGWTNINEEKDHGHNDKLVKISVRDGCKVNVWSHNNDDTESGENYEIVHEAGYGNHMVPNFHAGTLSKIKYQMSASSTYCECGPPTRN